MPHFTAHRTQTYDPATRNTRLLFAFCLLVATFAAYWPALHGEFIWDDDRHVSNNHTLLTLVGLKHIWLSPLYPRQYLPQWYPLTHTTFWIEHQIFGLNTLGYHIDNVLLHVCNALLFGWLLRLLKVPGSTLATVIFALHPIEAESVAWISERKNLLSTCMALLSIIVYWRASRWTGFLGAFILFLFAMLSKTVACSTPAVLLVLLWWTRGRPSKFDLLRLLPFFLVGLGLAYFTAWTEKNYVGASGPEWDISAISRMLIASRAIWFYAAKLLVPMGLTFNYPRWQIDPHDWRLYLFPLALVGLFAALCCMRRRIGDGPLAAWVIFVGVLVPALGFLNTYPMRYSFVADHFQYTAGMALIALFSAMVSAMFARLRFHQPLAFVLGGVLAALTFCQSRIYAGPEALWRDTAWKNPASWMALENLAVSESIAGRPAEALPLFATVARLKPDHDRVHANWGDALFALGRWFEALEQYRLAIPSAAVDQSQLHDRIGVVQQKLDHADDAIAEYRKSLSFNLQNVAARSHLADAIAARGDLQEALTQGDQVLAITPDASDELRATASWLIRLHRTVEAEERLRYAIAINPDDVEARLALATLELNSNRSEAAARDFSAVTDREPNNVDARNGLLRALTQSALIKPALIKPAATSRPATR